MRDAVKAVLRKLHLTYFLMETLPALEPVLSATLFSDWSLQIFDGTHHRITDEREREKVIRQKARDNPETHGQTLLVPDSPLAREDLERSLKLFFKLLETFQQKVTGRGAMFQVVLAGCGNGPHNDSLEHLIRGLGIAVINMNDLLKSIDYNNIYTLKKNKHWNERGNHLAAAGMLRNLRERLAWPIDDGRIKALLGRYYAAFDPSLADPEWLALPQTANREEIAMLRRKYIDNASSKPDHPDPASE